MKKTVSVLLILAAFFLAASPLSVTASASAGELTLDEAADIVRNGWQFYYYYACEGYYRSIHFMPQIGSEIDVTIGDRTFTFHQLDKDGYTTPNDFKKEMERYFDTGITDKMTGFCYECRLRGIDHPMFYEKDGIWYKAHTWDSNVPNSSVWNVYDLKINGDRATVNAVMSMPRYTEDPDRDFALEIVLKRGSDGWRISEEGDLIRLMCGELSWEEYSTTHPAPKVSHDTDKFTYTEACDLVRRGGSFYSCLQFNAGATDGTKYFTIEGVELLFGRIPCDRRNMPYSNAEEALAMTKQYFTDEIAEGSVTYCLAELRPDSYPYEQGVKKCPLFYVYEGVTYKYIGGWQSEYNPGDIYYARNFRCDGDTATMDVVLHAAGGDARGPYFTTSVTFVKTPNGWRIGDCDYTKLAMSKIYRHEYAIEHRTDPVIPLDNCTDTAAGLSLSQAVAFVREAAGFFYHLQYAPSYSVLGQDKIEVELPDGSVKTYDPLSSSDGYMTVDECREKAGKYFVSGTLDRMLGNCRFCANNGKTHPVFYVKDGVTYKARCSYQPVFKQTDFKPTDIDDARNFRLSGDRAVFTATLFNYNSSSDFDVDIVLVKTADGWRIDDCDYLKLALYELDLNEYSRTHPVTAPPTGDGAGIRIFALSALALASAAVLVRALPRRRKYGEV